MEIFGVDLAPVELVGVVALVTVLLAIALRNVAPALKEIRTPSISNALRDRDFESEYPDYEREPGG